MSTTPTQVLQATEPELDIESIKQIMDGFDPASLLPPLEEIFGSLTTVCRWAVMIAPVIMLVMGLAYLFLAPKEANYYFGYRCYFGMGSIRAWRFTQRLAGLLFTAVGLILTLIMASLSAGFGAMEVTAMVWRCVSCLAWQAGITLLTTLAINLTAAAFFDHRGELRRRKARPKNT